MVPIAYMPSPIPGRSDGTCSLVQFHSLRPSHELWAGRLLHHYFRGLLSVHSRYSLHARRVALATLCTRGFSSFVASTAALIATGWSEPVPGRVYPRCGPAPSRRTRVARDTGAIANAPKTILPRNPPGFRLLQAKFFSRRHQCDRFANAPLARFRSFSRMNPNDEVTSVGGRQLPKELPRFGICLQRFGDVDR